MNKTAIVTGASSGLGKVLVNILTKQGWFVFALSRHVKEVNFNAKVKKISCDISSLASITKAFEQIDKQTTSIELLINCAGQALVKSFEDTSDESIEELLAVNLRGSIYVTKQVYSRMIKNQSGQIINIGSTSSLKARDMEVLYCATKWGLRGFTNSLRLEARKHGIKVTGIYPGGMNTNFWKILPDKDISNYMKPELVAQQVINVVNQVQGIALAEVVIERP